MRRVTAAIALTAAGVAAVVGAKASSAGAPRSALAGGEGAGTAHSAAPRPAHSGGGTEPGSGATHAPSGSGAGPGSGGFADGSFLGATEQTVYGPMQVRAVVRSGALASVDVVQHTDAGRSDQIDSFALPMLQREALKAQSADIDVVSGATFTSTGYARSLQSALDKAAAAKARPGTAAGAG